MGTWAQGPARINMNPTAYHQQQSGSSPLKVIASFCVFGKCLSMFVISDFLPLNVMPSRHPYSAFECRPGRYQHARIHPPRASGPTWDGGISWNKIPNPWVMHFCIFLLQDSAGPSWSLTSRCLSGKYASICCGPEWYPIFGKLPELEAAKNTTDLKISGFWICRLWHLHSWWCICSESTGFGISMDQCPTPKAQAAAQAVVLPQPLLTEQTLRQLRPKTVGQGKIIPHSK